MAQMKELNKTPEKQNKMEISNLSDAKFKILVIRMLKELIGRLLAKMGGIGRYMLPTPTTQRRTTN